MSMTRMALAGVALVVGLLLLTPVAVILAPFAAVASLTRLLAGLRRRPATTPWRELTSFEPEVGWRLRADLDAYGASDEPFHLTTGADGWRGGVSFEEADVAVFGDSFAFGHGVDDRQLYTRSCGGLQVKPVGCDGYSMVHVLLWMQRLADHLAGKLVVWFVYSGNDLHEALSPNLGRYRMPFVRQHANGGGCEVVTSHVTQVPWPFPTPSYYHTWLAELSCPTPTSDRVFAASGYLVEQAQQVCASVGATLVVVSIPMRVQITRGGRRQLRMLSPDPAAFDVDRPDRMLRGACERVNVHFASLRPHLRSADYLAGDIHWTPRGHRKVGTLLRELHRRHGRGNERKGV